MKIKNTTCYGAGLIGTGWATNFLQKGLKVVMYDISDDLFAQAEERIRHNLDFLAEEGIYTKAEVDGFMANYSATSDPAAALKDADFIQENGPENLELKQQIIETIETYAKPDAVIASSTSGLNISDIAAKAKHPERIVGGHPYNPVFLIPLVELTAGPKTDPAVLDAAVEFYRFVQKEPVVLKKEAPGFISNRLQAAVIREAADLVDRGVCTVEEVDKALLFGPGLRYGLLGQVTISNLAGGTHGISGAMQHMGTTMTKWYEDMATWTSFPETWLATVQQGVDEAIANRPPSQGNTVEGVMRFRDKGLVMLLKYHEKL
ncbi:3-hydroxyacyl-CoA dehydrogenase family protein [Ruminococcaceae bacterium OttesenSCG-928-O06]|nr:3-hydroxyacyl-CoA dehydrogenase family protein [Ruminococcaceae bacterium OttesenSCG-928-O06]